MVEKLDKICGLVCQQRMAAKLTTISYEILFSPASKALSWRQVRDQNYVVNPDQSDGENPSFNSWLNVFSNSTQRHCRNHSFTLVSAILLHANHSVHPTCINSIEHWTPNKVENDEDKRKRGRESSSSRRGMVHYPKNRNGRRRPDQQGLAKRGTQVAWNFCRRQIWGQ